MGFSMKRSLVIAVVILAAMCAGCGGGGPVSVAQAQVAAKIELARLHFILRPDAAGLWYVQNDAEHASYGVLPTVDQTDSTLTVHFDRAYRYAGTVQISSDDDYLGRVRGYASLGLSKVVIKITGDGRQIDPKRAVDYAAPGVGNLWVNVTMVNK